MAGALVDASAGSQSQSPNHSQSQSRSQSPSQNESQTQSQGLGAKLLKLHETHLAPALSQRYSSTPSTHASTHLVNPIPPNCLPFPPPNLSYPPAPALPSNSIHSPPQSRQLTVTAPPTSSTHQGTLERQDDALTGWPAPSAIESIRDDVCRLCLAHPLFERLIAQRVDQHLREFGL